MSFLRQDLATKDWTIIAPGRSLRPDQYIKAPKKPETEDVKKVCPFCKGNEKKTSEELLSISDNGSWIVRVVANKYPALATREIIKGSIKRSMEGPYLKIDGIGSHEVVIESPRHEDDISNMKISHIKKIIKAYRTRYSELSKNKDYQLIIIFRNHGEIAGSSLRHPHSQIVATPFVPNYVRNKLSEAQRYFDDFGECVYCDMIQFELESKERIIYENKDFVAFAPYASIVPYNIMIIPKSHKASFIETPENKISNLASILSIVLKKLHGLLNDPDYNYVIDSTPTDKSDQRSYHWHLEILPRLTTMAGFEIGSGVSINTMPPEDCAKLLRDFRI